jgi:hypothetical protein
MLDDAHSVSSILYYLNTMPLQGPRANLSMA